MTIYNNPVSTTSRSNMFNYIFFAKYCIIVILLVTFAVTVDLRLPEGGVGLGQHKLSTSLMPVPETAVDENRRSVSAHHYIRLARHALHVQPVPVSVRPQPFPDRYLRLRRLAAYMRHAAVPLCRCQNVGHISCYSFVLKVPNMA